MERRLQLLLDEARYGRVADEAQRSGRSVAAVIREAIDCRFPDGGHDIRIAAARRLLEMSAQPDPDEGESPEELKAQYEEMLDAKIAAP